MKRKIKTLQGKDLKDVVVKATRVKIVFKNDTVVYNADAFNLPNGSMLDELIRQLPGVKLTDSGEIFLNGKTKRFLDGDCLGCFKAQSNQKSYL